jgi:ATP/maltotriose-dependent transcriptional regulator MalT
MSEDLPFTVVRSNGTDEVLARAINLMIARGAYQVAARAISSEEVETRIRNAIATRDGLDMDNLIRNGKCRIAAPLSPASSIAAQRARALIKEVARQVRAGQKDRGEAEASLQDTINIGDLTQAEVKQSLDQAELARDALPVTHKRERPLWRSHAAPIGGR